MSAVMMQAWQVWDIQRGREIDVVYFRPDCDKAYVLDVCTHVYGWGIKVCRVGL